MFPTPSKVTRLWLLPAVALALMLLVYAVFASAQAQAQNGPIPAGDYCIEGIVIDWEEEPLEGWVITLTSDISGFVPITTTSAPEPEDNGDAEPDFKEGEFEFKDLEKVAAVYTATIETRAGWEGVTPTTITFPIEVGNDDCVRIRFKMRRIIPVTVVKIDANHDPLEDWKIQAVPGPGNLFAEPEEEETDITGTAVFTLTPGLWYFIEMPPERDDDDGGAAYVPVVPPNGRQELDIDDDQVLPLFVVFKNELVTGCILVQKVGLTGNEGDIIGDPTIDAVYGVGGWGFKLLRMDDTVARQGVTDAKGQVRFEGLPLGPYILVEEDRAGWNEVSADELAIQVTGNQCDEAEAIVFQNEQNPFGFCIEGRKIDANGGYGIPDWEIEIKALDEDGFEPANAFTDGLGEYRFEFPKNDYRIPGAKYEVCEDEKDGWLAHTATCQTVQLPEWPGQCVDLKDFVNQQVGHSESQKQGGVNGDEMNGDERNGDERNGDERNGDERNRGEMNGGEMNGGDNGRCATYHVAKPGEGLYDIGRMYNQTPQQMLNANPDIKNSDRQWVFIGQKVCIP